MIFAPLMIAVNERQIYSGPYANEIHKSLVVLRLQSGLTNGRTQIV